jgi:hypothetical protein
VVPKEPRAPFASLLDPMHSAKMAPDSPAASFAGEAGGGGGGAPFGRAPSLYSEAAFSEAADLDDGAAADEFALLRELDDYVSVTRHAEFAADRKRQKAARATDGGAGVDEELLYAGEFDAAPPTLAQAMADFSDYELSATPVALLRYADRSMFMVRVSGCLSRAYNLFNISGARHLLIVDYAGRPTGILTRVDLMRGIIIEHKRAFDDAEQLSFASPPPPPLEGDTEPSAPSPGAPLLGSTRTLSNWRFGGASNTNLSDLGASDEASPTHLTVDPASTRRRSTQAPSTWRADSTGLFQSMGGIGADPTAAASPGVPPPAVTAVAPPARPLLLLPETFSTRALPSLPLAQQLR